MKQAQVVKVHGTRFGSGYLIAPRLVLTSSHLLAPGADVTVSVPASAGGRFAAAVRWDGGSALDAAVLEVTDADWSPPPTLQGHFSRHVQRWGRCVTAGSTVPVAAMGFPGSSGKTASGHPRSSPGRSGRAVTASWRSWTRTARSGETRTPAHRGRACRVPPSSWTAGTCCSGW